MNAVVQEGRLYPSLESLVVDRDSIRAIALDNHFKLKPQDDGSEDLHEYVYHFSASLAKLVQTPRIRELSRLLNDLLDQCYEEAWNESLTGLRVLYRSGCALLGREPESDDPFELAPSLPGLSSHYLRDIAVDQGFKLKPQGDGDNEDLNPYVYAFAHAMVEHIEREKTRQLENAVSDIMTACRDQGWANAISERQALYLHACIVIDKKAGSDIDATIEG